MENHTRPASEKFSAGTHVPYWVETVQPISFEKLALDKEVDVVIVGGGIAGVTIAYCLCHEGKRVALVEDGFIGSGETGRTTAHLVNALDDRFYELERLFGTEQLKHIAESHSAAIDFIERTVTKENIQCDFKRLDGFLFAHASDKPQNLQRELEASQRAGLSTEMTSIALGKKMMEAIRFPNQATFHPLKYLHGLSTAVIKAGGAIYTGTHAKTIDTTGIITDQGVHISAKHVVVATNTPVNNNFAMMKQYAYRTYVITLALEQQIPEALWWDTGDFSSGSQFPPYHYVRLLKHNNHTFLVVGGEDHPVGLADSEGIPEEDRYGRLEAWAREHFNNLGEVMHTWSGEVMEPMDALAYIGRNPKDPDNMYTVTGDSGNGLTHATIAGKMITDAIMGRHNPWEELYAPKRTHALKAGKTFFKEFVGGLINYLKTKPKHLDTTGLKDILRNEGKVIEFEGQKFGAYRDENDNIHFVAAECTHLGCLVKWNNDEKSWDCPCHGSRFTYDGQVMHGPANKPLAYYTQNKNAIQNI